MLVGTPLLDAAVWEGQIFLDGAWCETDGGAADIIEPATGESLGRAGRARPGDVARAAKAALRAQREWASALPNERAEVMRRAGLLLNEHSADVTEWILRETGSIRPKASFEIDASFAEFMEAAALATRPNGELLAPVEQGQTSIARRVPIGVIGVITPWNSPLILAMRVLGPALALGNAVILKPDPQTPVTGGILLARLFEQAGLPAGVLQVLPGGAEVGEALVTEPGVGMISFTGSTEVGRRVGTLAGAELKKVSLELGGNNAIIILDDADLEVASSAASFGAFFHQGQICMTAGRHLVQASVADKYAELLGRRAEALPVGNTFTQEVAIGPMINSRQVERVDRIVSATLAEGATLVAGGTHDGLFYQPTVLTEVAPTMPAFAEEIFGPVAPITVFADDQAAVELANRTDYGLAAAIQTRSLARGLAIADQLKTGIVHLNDQTIADHPSIPFGGMGASGNGGRFGSPANHDEFTQWQWLTFREKQKAYPF